MASVRSAGSIRVTFNDQLTLVDFASLEIMYGHEFLQNNIIQAFVLFQDNPSLVSLRLPSLEVVYADLCFPDRCNLDFIRNRNLATISLPSLRSTEAGLTIRINPLLETVQIPILERIGRADGNSIGYPSLVVHGNQNLLSVNAASLQSIESDFVIYDNPLLEIVTVSRLSSVNNTCWLSGNPSWIELDFLFDPEACWPETVCGDNTCQIKNSVNDLSKPFDGFCSDGGPGADTNLGAKRHLSICHRLFRLLQQAWLIQVCQER